MDLDEVADELYEVPPDEFIALRKTRQDEAKADGDKALAKDIGALPKPSAAAWVCNLLVRAQRPEIEGLIELGDLLRQAQQNLAGDQLKALDVQRRRVIAALTQQARSLAYERGSAVSTTVATQVEETLRAAMADPEAGEALLTGRLTSPMSYNGGLGTTVGRPDLRLIRSPKPQAAAREKPPAEKPTRPAASGDRQSAEDRRRAREAAEEEKRRAAAEKRRRELAEARQAADEAASLADEALAAADEQRRLVEAVRARHDDLQARVDDLADQLAEAERAAAEAATELKRAERRRSTAEREAADAVSARDTAVARADRLEETAD
jgi:hypothetical protein